MSPFTPFNASTLSTVIINSPLPTPSLDAANGANSVLEALAENNIAQWVMLGLAVPAAGFALYQIVTCIQLLVGPPHPNNVVAIDAEGVPVHAGDIELTTINHIPPPILAEGLNEASPAHEASVEQAFAATTATLPEAQPLENHSQANPAATYPSAEPPLPIGAYSRV